MVEDNDFAHDSKPTIFISGDEDKLGIITNMNLTAASLFGYSKAELISKLFRTFCKRKDAKDYLKSLIILYKLIYIRVDNLLL